MARLARNEGTRIDAAAARKTQNWLHSSLVHERDHDLVIGGCLSVFWS